MLNLAMMRGMSRHFIIWTLFLVLSGQAYAVGFDQAKLRSHLGEPLHVLVPLLLSEGEDFGHSKVSLASPQEYKNLEQRLPLSYQSMRVDVEGLNTQTPVAVITSRQAIDEGIIMLVLKVQRGRGNFYKTMQFFLDDVAQTLHKQEPVQNVYKDAKTAYSEPLLADKASQPQVMAAQGLMPVPASSGWSRRSSYGPVQSGDSLSEIAYRLRKDKRWSNRQIMLALYQSNPDAFVNKNINQLKQGSFLNVPDDEAVRSFIESGDYEASKPLLARKNWVSKAKKASVVNQAEEKNAITSEKKPKFHGRISLGLDQSNDKPIVNAMLLKRLEKLEPLYKQAMASDLRMDGIGDKVDSLTKEVGQLHQKIDALALRKADKGEDGGSAGWIGFFALLMLNILLGAAFYYRKQMRTWQGKLLEAQRSAKAHNSDVMIQAGAVVEDEGVAVDQLKAEGKSQARAEERTKAQPEKESVREPRPRISHTMDSDWETDTQEIEPVREPEEAEQDSAFYAVAFEDKVHKHDWLKADEYYGKMDEVDCIRPRIQALLVERLHGEGDVLGRNTTLLTLYNLYDEKKWQRFCSSFDESIWQTLQEEKIISFTGKVNQAQVEVSNKAVASQPAKPVTYAQTSESESKATSLANQDDGALDLSDASIQALSMDDFAFDDDQGSLSSNLDSQTDELDSTFIMDAQDVAEPKEAVVKVKDDEGLEVDFEFDFSVPDFSETPESEKGTAEAGGLETNPSEKTEPKESNQDDVQVPDFDGLSLELDDSDLELDEKKD